MATSLRKYSLPSFIGGYNSYPDSKSQVKDNEIPAVPGVTENVWLDDNGAAEKRPGWDIWSGPMATGYAVHGMDEYSTSSFDIVIAACGTNWWKCGAGTAVALTGATFTAGLDTFFCQGCGVFHGANGTDPFSYTTDGATISQVTTNTIIGKYPCFYNSRIYMTSTANPDRIYYSNPYGFTNPATGVTATGTATVTSGQVTGVTITNPGNAYASAPVITFTGGGATSTAYASAIVSASGVVTSVSMTSGGAGYTSAPTVTFAAPPNQGSVSDQTAITGFDYTHLFDTDLSQTPKQNSGFIALAPGSGLVITRLFLDGDTLYVFTVRHGIWTISPAQVNSDGTLAHAVSQIVIGTFMPAPRSVFRVSQNDQFYFGGDAVYSRGEVQYYASPRITNQTGRVRSEMRNIVAAAQPGVSLTFFQNKVYVAYQNGPSYNDSVIVQDRVLNAWSSSFSGWNISCFLNFQNRLFVGSSNSAYPYIYELLVGTNDAGTAIKASFETKSTDFGMPGLVKRLGFINVLTSLLYGTITYQVYADEVAVAGLSGTVQIGQSSTGSIGFGSETFGTFPMGVEYTPGASNGSTSDDTYIRIPCNYTAGVKFSVGFSNVNLNDQFKVVSVDFWYKPSKSPYEVTNAIIA